MRKLLMMIAAAALAASSWGKDQDAITASIKNGGLDQPIARGKLLADRKEQWTARKAAAQKAHEDRIAGRTRLKLLKIADTIQPPLQTIQGEIQIIGAETAKIKAEKALRDAQNAP